MKSLIAVLVLATLAGMAASRALAQGSPTEDELLDFDSMDKSQTVTRPTRAKPAAPSAPQAAPAAPAPAAPAPQVAKPARQPVAPAAQPAPPPAPEPQVAQPEPPPAAAPATEMAAPAPVDESGPTPVLDEPAPPPPPPAPQTVEAPPPVEPQAPGQAPVMSAPEQKAQTPAPPPKNAPETKKAQAAPKAAPKAAEVPAPAPEAPPPAPEPQVAEPQVEPPPPEILDAEKPVAPAPEEEPPPPPKSQKVAEPEPPAPAPAEEGGVSAADERNEARFARIYRKYNTSEIGDSKWTEIAGDHASENYTLQDGDTLWDISSKFFGNGFYWPKVWQLNDKITNPHLVRPGNTLVFSAGSTTAAPTLGVNENQDEEKQRLAEIPENAESAGEGEPAPEIEEFPTSGAPTGNTIIIPPPKKRHPVLTKIPPSFPDWTYTNHGYDENGFYLMEVNRANAESHRKPTAIPELISENPWEPAGEVNEMEGMSDVAATYQKIVVKLDKPANRGDIFTVYRDRGEIKDPIEGGTVGTKIDTRGLIEIEGPVEGAPDHYRGVVTFTTLPIHKGDLVRQGNLIAKAFFDTSGSPSNVSARIVSGEMGDADHGERHFVGLQNVVFLNKGEQDGLQVGNILNVIKNTKARNPKSVLNFDPDPIGLLKVVAVGPHVATAVIVKERDAIMPGDETSVAGALESLQRREANGGGGGSTSSAAAEPPQDVSGAAEPPPPAENPNPDAAPPPPADNPDQQLQ